MAEKLLMTFLSLKIFDLTDKAMPPTRACVLKNTLKISLHFLTLADMIKTLKSQIQIMSNSAVECFYQPRSGMVMQNQRGSKVFW